ncbi:MAG: non-ribosomal peptide synthetase [Coleofasciculus sp. A1-SPW-01]|uniref:non-ribosomal peptide synthetase n=1 Tax=Coleofasciculus sp. A1-SPW-01 TaxID=3070819 RepID=UPI0032FFB0F8
MNDQPTTLWQILKAQAAIYPEHLALSSLASPPLTYQHLWELVDQTQRQLRQWGICREQRVVMVAPANSAVTLSLSFAIASSAICIPLNPNFTQSEFLTYLQQLHPQALVIVSNCADAAAKAAVQLDLPIILATPLPNRTGWFQLQETTEIKTQSVLSPPSPEDIAFVFQTSGSTAQPKFVPVTHKGLCYSSSNVKDCLQLGTDDICLNVLPLFHVHGLVTNGVVPLIAGNLICLYGNFEASVFWQWLNQSQATWFSVPPTIHQAILQAAPKIPPKLPLQFIRSGSAALSPHVKKELTELLNVPFLEAYGMSEALTITNTPLPPSVDKPGSVGKVVNGNVAIINESGEPLPPQQVGEIAVRGNHVTPGYLDNLEANPTAFINGWFRTGDIGYLDAEGDLFLVGRSKEMINRGGEKISPQEVDAVLLKHPQVLEVATFGISHPSLGEDIAAAVVLKENDVSLQHLRDYLFDHLAPYKIPSQILIVESIPRGTTGKIIRQELAAYFSDKLTPIYATPRTETEVKIAQICSEVLGIETIGLDDNFFALGGHSLLATQVISRLRQAFGIELSFLSFFATPTVAGLSQEIEKSYGVKEDYEEGEI